MPPKVTNLTTFKTAPGNTKKGLSHSIHSPQADDGPQIRPTHFIIRKGNPGAIVPVIPVDLLPDYVTIVGLSRTLTINDTTGMSNLGTFAKPQGHFQLQFASPAHDRPTGRGPEMLDVGCLIEPQRLGPNVAKVGQGTGKQSHMVKRTGVPGASKSATSHSTPRTLSAEAPLLAPPPPPPRVLDWAEDDTDSVSTDDFSSAELSAPDTSSKSSSGSRDKRKPFRRVQAPAPASAVIKEKSDAEIAERMLELGRVQQHAATLNHHHHHHPAQAPKTTAAAAASHSSDGSTSAAAAGVPKPTPPKPTAGKQKLVRPDGSLCRHWCQTGQCSWGTECRYMHQMPLTLEGLADVNLTELPSWWRKQAGLPAEGTIDPRIFAVATVPATGLKKSSSSSPFPAALGVVNTATPLMVALEMSKKSARVKPGKAERRMARELRGVPFGVEGARVRMPSSPVVTVGSKKKLGLGRLQSRMMEVQQVDELVEKLVDI
ncbi:hypothetical protein CSAL01_08079 [Colletotrichum salicis]|uniref:C3H1-type domain-containing protein n=1 Tax=Colletotrichum salicis TaxID=1209931 RepID=A0A135UUS2_9PEZI|nr:hypothetical protein CSAL01_08079 [Colletotrichum salicis]